MFLVERLCSVEGRVLSDQDLLWSEEAVGLVPAVMVMSPSLD